MKPPVLNTMKILVVEDETDVQTLIALHLKREGYEVTCANDGATASQLLEKHNFNLIVLDWMLPFTSGIEICKRLRAQGDNPNQQVPILMVTARAETSDIVLGIEMGADDFVTKPFEISILLARVRALLRRAATLKEIPSKVLQIANLQMDLVGYSVSCSGSAVELTRSEFKLLSTLLENRGKVYTRSNLIAVIQGGDVSVTDRTIDTHVFGLRKKLGPCGDLIETIRGVGYRVGN